LQDALVLGNPELIMSDLRLKGSSSPAERRWPKRENCCRCSRSGQRGPSSRWSMPHTYSAIAISKSSAVQPYISSWSEEGWRNFSTFCLSWARFFHVGLQVVDEAHRGWQTSCDL